MQLTFSFAQSSSVVELVETSFIANDKTREFRSVRGKTSGAYADFGSFQWTSAVRALCELFLRFKISAQDREETPHSSAIMAGGVGSAAASLNYAIQKQPQWLLDMFGVDGRGVPTLRRLVYCSNPSLKRVGGTAITVNPRIVNQTNLHFLINGKIIEDTQDLSSLKNLIAEKCIIADSFQVVRAAAC